MFQMTGSCANALRPQGEDGCLDAEARDFQKQNDCNIANQIVMLEKNIGFIKMQHSQMLATLHFEIERLKKVNQDLQRRIFLETAPDAAKDENPEKGELLTKIIDLESKLLTAQNKNDLLKRELEARKRYTAAKKHNVAQSHSPIIQKAEQIRKPSELGSDDEITAVAGDFLDGSRKNWRGNAQYRERSQLDHGSTSYGSQLIPAQTMSYIYCPLDSALPPIDARPDTASSSFGVTSLVSEPSPVTPGVRVDAPTGIHFHPPMNPQLFTHNLSISGKRSTSAGRCRRRADSKARLTPLKLVPPMPSTGAISRQIPPQVISSPIVPSGARKTYLPSMPILASIAPRQPPDPCLHLMPKGDVRPIHTAPAPHYDCRKESHSFSRGFGRRPPISPQTSFRHSLDTRPPRPPGRRRFESEGPRKAPP